MRERPWVIIGCGYTGTRLARCLVAQGAEVWVTRRSPRDAADLARTLGVPEARACALDLERHQDIASTLAAWLPRGAYFVDSAPPCASSPQAEQALVHAAHAADVARALYISSTGVYPPSDGAWIDETSPVGPTSAQGRARLLAETGFMDACETLGVTAVCLRAVGIYGPGRGVHARLHAGTYRVIGNGDTYVNRVHVDDLVSALIAAALIPGPAERVYLVADDQPECSRVYADAVADIMGVPHPPSVPESSVPPWVVSMLRANRRVANIRMKEQLGVRLAYPTWREGLRQVLDEDGIPGAAKQSPAQSPD